MNATFALLTAPTVEPVTLVEAKAHLKVDDTAEDLLITAAVKTARAAVEDYLNRGLLPQTWRYAQDAWTDTIWLPRAAPLVSVTWVKYYDAAGVLQTLASGAYLVDTLSEPARLHLAPGQPWPALQARPSAVSVEYVVGWSTPAAVPEAIKWAVLLKLGALYLQREDVTASVVDLVRDTGAVTALLAPHRVWWRPPC